MAGAALRSDVKRFFLQKFVQHPRIETIADSISHSIKSEHCQHNPGVGKVAMIGCLRTDRTPGGTDKLRRSTIANTLGSRSSGSRRRRTGPSNRNCQDAFVRGSELEVNVKLEYTNRGARIVPNHLSGAKRLNGLNLWNDSGGLHGPGKKSR